MRYHLEYVEKPGKFDEIVEQDGVRVLLDSKALFSIIGSEMHWQEDRLGYDTYLYLSSLSYNPKLISVSLSAKFVFQNPNIADACGCGESFKVTAT